MKILHTADWHLGKKLDFFSRLKEQVEVMQEIESIADEQQVDAIIIAGDLFDNFNPPIEAVDLFYQTLKNLSNNGKRPVIAIAGNHDAPQRIDAPDPLARASGIILIGHPKALVRPFTSPNSFEVVKSDYGFLELQLDRFDYPLRIIHTPYANEARMKQYLDEEDQKNSLNEALRSHWKSLADSYCDNKGVNILMTHLYMMQKGKPTPEEPEGERPLRIGNAELIDSNHIPKVIQYTALGHLHQCFNIGSQESPAYYAGSPLSYSFSEAGQKKQVIIIDIEPNQPPLVEKIELKKGRKLERKAFDNILEAESYLIANPESLFELSIRSDVYLTAEEISKLRRASDGIIHLIPLVNSPEAGSTSSRQINLSEDMETLFVNYFTSQHGQKPSQEILEIFNELTTK